MQPHQSRAKVCPNPLAGLSDPRGAIMGPRRDALLFWGAPLVIFLAVKLWLALASRQGAATSELMANAVLSFSIIITYAHLVAVVPRAYLNREVFAANRAKLTLVPIALLAIIEFSPLMLAVLGVIAIFWDIHHSAMQNFGLARIYDLKGGNMSDRLRRTDLRLNWSLYVGPLVAGASLMAHLHAFDRLDQTTFAAVTRLPGLLETRLSAISMVGMALWAIAIFAAVIDYRRAAAEGYQMPPHKLALIVTTGLVSLLAWGFSSPLVALAAINIYHAIQYFALVWLKEGERMKAAMPSGKWLGSILFFGLCGLFGLAYALAAPAHIQWLGGIFLASSLLHFWFDGFVWSVRKRQV
jgi:hypothetical protein